MTTSLYYIVNCFCVKANLGVDLLGIVYEIRNDTVFNHSSIISSNGPGMSRYSILPSKHEMLAQRRFTAGPPSTKLTQQ